MPDPSPRPPAHQRFLAELKRRHVFRVMAVYGATGFVVLQAADLLVAGLALPDAILQAATVFVLLGFPIALVLAWAYDRTPAGLRRTDPAATGELEAIVALPAARRWPSGLFALAGFAALLAGVWLAGRRSGAMSAAESERTAAADVSGEARDSEDAILRIAYADLSTDERPSVAVLPFVNMSADEEQEYFADGMTEELLNALAKVSDLRVAGRTSSFAYKGKDRDLREIGDELGVRYLVEGSVRKQGDRLRITAQLVDADDNFHVWSETYDRTLDDVFAIQTEIAESVAGALEVSLGLTGDEVLVTPTADLDAYDLYLAAQARLRQREEGVAESIRLFEAAVARDSSWAPAWSGLALARTILPYYVDFAAFESAETWSQALDAAERAAGRALALDPENATAEVALGSVYRDRWEWGRAEEHFLRALEIDPDNAEAHQQYADMLSAIGRLDEAIRSARRAVALDPTSAIRTHVLGFIMSVSGHPEDALREFRRATELDPDLLRAWVRMLATLEELGDFDAALNSLTREFLPLLVAQGRIAPADTAALVRYQTEVYAALRSGDTDSLAALAESGPGSVPPERYARLGDTERALEALTAEIEREAAADLRYGTSYHAVLWSSVWDGVRDDPRFRAALRHYNLEGVVPRRPPSGQ
jgi:adenylate cyclase